MKSQSLLSLSAWLLAVLAVPLTAAAQDPLQRTLPADQYTVADLGTLEGGTFSQPFSINRYGLVSGSSTLPDGTQHAALWLEELKVDIGVPGLGGPNSIAFGDNQRFQSAGEPLLRIPRAKISADSLRTSPVYLSCGRTGE
jgi:hypothetical protein